LDKKGREMRGEEGEFSPSIGRGEEERRRGH